MVEIIKLKKYFEYIRLNDINTLNLLLSTQEVVINYQL